MSVAHRKTLRVGAGSCRAGIALIEAVLSALTIGVMLLAALQTVSHTRAGHADNERRAMAFHLASELMAEVLNQPYVDPDLLNQSGGGPMAVEPSKRSTFNWVGDYHGWSESPPQEFDGTPREHLKRWSRVVEVVNVSPSNLGQTSMTDQGVKRITVSVKHRDVTLARLIALRTSAIERE